SEPRYQLRGIVPGGRTHDSPRDPRESIVLAASPYGPIIERDRYRSRVPDLLSLEDEFLLSYRATEGHVVIQHGRYVASNHRVDWGRPVSVVDSATGDSIVPAELTSPGLGRLENWPGLG